MNDKSRIIRPYLSRFPLVALVITCSGLVSAQIPVPVDDDGNPLASAASDVVLDSAIDTQIPVPVDDDGNPLASLDSDVVLDSAIDTQIPVPVDDDGNPLASLDSDVVLNGAIDTQIPTFTMSELEEMVGTIALYPDNLLAIILPASTYPLEIVLAARFLEQLESDSTLQADEAWDETVIALLNYPEVVQLMNENIQWTWELGVAVISQEADVLAAIGSFRDRALAAGNLNSDEFQNVTSSDDAISITQVNETVVYVPYYVPEEVIVYQSQPVYHYYPRPYPLYYYPYAAGHHFRSDYFWGVTTAFTIGWFDHHLHVYHPSYSRHPYYGRSYDSRHHYRRPNIRAFNRSYVDNHYRMPRDRQRDGSYWRPQRNSGVRPNDRRNRSSVFSATNVASVPNTRGGNRGANAGRRLSSDRPARTAISNNDPNTQSLQGSNRRQGSRPGADRNAEPIANALTNSSTPATNNRAAAVRVRAPGSENRPSVSDRRRSSRDSTNVRGVRSGRSAATVLANNNSNTQTTRGSSGNQRVRQASGRTVGSLASALTNPATSATISPSPTNRARVPRSDVRSTADDRQRRDRIGSRVRNQSNSNTVRGTSNRQERTTVTRNQRAVPSETRSRQARQAPTRQRAAPQPRRSEQRSTNSRSSARANSRSTRSNSQSTRAPSVSRSAPASARQPSRSNRSRSSSRGSRREP